MMMRRRALLAGSALALPAWAQQRFDRIPEPGPALPPPLPQVQDLRLANGLRLVLAQRRGWPLVSVNLLLNAGSLLDPPGKAGLAQLYLDVTVHGARRGRATVDAGDIAFAAESLGASLETNSGPQAGSLGFTLPTPRLDEGLALLADLARHPTLPASELARSRSQALEAYRLNLADPAALAQLLGRRLYWGDSTAGRQATPASLARVRREDLLTLQRQQLRPELSTLVLAGDIEAGQARALAERYFGGWTAPRTPGLRPGLAQARPLALRTLLVDLPGAGQSAVLLLAPHAGAEAAADQVSGMMANAVLGQGYSSRLGQEVRIKRGLSYGASSQTESLPGGGWLNAFTQTRHESAAEVAALLRAEIARMGAAELGAAELAARRASLLGEHGRKLETTSGLAGLLSEQLLLGREPSSLVGLPQALAGVDAARLRDFARRYWRDDAVRCVIVSDLKVAGPALGALDPAAWVRRADELDLDAPDLRRARRG